MTAPLAVSIGDPAGIGPEIVAAAWAARDTENLPPFFAIGDRRALAAVWDGPVETLGSPADAAAAFDHALPLVQVDDPGEIVPGDPNLAGARCALDSLEIAVGLARNGFAGGIVTGRQMAACMAMGAAGAWTGSVWLTTSEAETSPVVKEKMIAATSAGTIRSRSRTGKFCRQLRSSWTDAWEQEGAPRPLPMPLQSMVSDTSMSKVLKLANGGHAGAKELASYFVGQGVGLMNSTQGTKAVVMEFMSDYLLAVERLQGTLED